MACPFFYPTVRHDAELWPFRRRLPLGDGFQGQCTAPGHEGTVPDDPAVADCCNLGHAKCPRLPEEREADAVHFSIASDSEGVVCLHWVLVKQHAAASFGRLYFERASQVWSNPHPSVNVQRMAQCYLESYLTRRGELRPIGAAQ